jgi:hypothetical protein
MHGYMLQMRDPPRWRPDCETLITHPVRTLQPALSQTLGTRHSQETHTAAVFTRQQNEEVDGVANATKAVTQVTQQGRGSTRPL